jgi:hypothetical protein
MAPRSINSKACSIRKACPVTHEDIVAIHAAIDDSRKAQQSQAEKLAGLLSIWEPARAFIFGNGKPPANVRIESIEKDVASVLKRLDNAEERDVSAHREKRERLTKVEMTILAGIVTVGTAFVQYAVPAIIHLTSK